MNLHCSVFDFLLLFQGKYDQKVSLGVNTSLSGPLLSRFDIVLVLQDMKNPEWDETVADHILNGTEHTLSTSGDAVSWLLCC